MLIGKGKYQREVIVECPECGAQFENDLYIDEIPPSPFWREHYVTTYGCPECGSIQYELEAYYKEKE